MSDPAPSIPPEPGVEQAAPRAMTLGDWLCILLDFLFSPRHRIATMGQSVYFFYRVYRYGPDSEKTP